MGNAQKFGYYYLLMVFKSSEDSVDDIQNICCISIGLYPSTKKFSMFICLLDNLEIYCFTLS